MRIRSFIAGLLLTLSALSVNAEYIGEYAVGTDNICKIFNTYQPSTGASFAIAAEEVDVYKDDGTTQDNDSGLTIDDDFDGLTGAHQVCVDTSSDGTFYSAGSTFSVVISAGTVDSVSVVGTEVLTFTLAKGALASGAITATVIATDAIGDAEIATGAIAATAFASGAIDASAIATDAIGAAELATDAVGAAELAADAIGDSEVATGAIAATAFAAGAIDAAAVATDAIGAAEIAADAIASSELAATAAAEIIDNFETQSQADPTGFHVNLLEVGGTAQTANDIGADANTTVAALANLVLVGPTTIGATGNSTTAVHLDGLTYGNDEINGYFLVIRDVSENEYHWREIADWVLASELATVATLPFTPEASTDVFSIIATLGAADVTGGDATAANQATILAALGTPSDFGAGATLADNLVDIEGQTDDIGAAGAGLTEAGGTGDQFTAINVASISGDATAADSLEAALDLQTGGNGAIPWLGIIASGTAQAYTAGTPSVTLAASTAAADNDFNGGTILVVGSNESDWQSATIADYTGATDIATIDAALETAPTGTISYIVFGTAEGAGGGASAAEVWAYATRILTALDEDSTTIDIDGSTVGVASSVAAVGSGAITATSIAADAIGASEIATDAIGALEVAADAIGASELAAGAIAASEIAADAIDADSIAADAIGASELATDAIGAAEMATDAIGAAEVAANAIGSSEVADGALDDGAVDDDAIGNGTALSEAGGTGDQFTAITSTMALEATIGAPAGADIAADIAAIPTGAETATAVLAAQLNLVGTCDSGSTTTCVDNALTQADATQVDERLICFDDDWCSLIDSFTPGTDTVTTTKTAPSTRASKAYVIYPATAQ